VPEDVENLKKQLPNVKSAAKEKKLFQAVDNEIYSKDSIKLDIDFLRQLDLSKVEAILICSFSDLLLLVCMMALHAPSCPIYSTTPVKQIGFFLVSEIYGIIAERNKIVSQSLADKKMALEKLHQAFEQRYGLDLSEWSDLFQLSDIEHTFEAIRELSFGQIVTLSHDVSF